MSKREKYKAYIEKLYANCRPHLHDPNFYTIAWKAFESVAEQCNDDEEINKLIVEKMKQLEKEAHIFGKTDLHPKIPSLRCLQER